MGFLKIKERAEKLVRRGITRYEFGQLNRYAEEHGRGELAGLTRFERGQLAEAFERLLQSR